MRRVVVLSTIGLFLVSGKRSAGFCPPPRSAVIAIALSPSTPQQQRQQCRYPSPGDDGDDEPTLFRSHRHRISIATTTTRMMTKDDRSSEEGKVADADADSSAASSSSKNGDDDNENDFDDDAVATATASGGGGGRGGVGEKDGPKKRYGSSGGFSMTLIPTLLFKFTIVLCIKFATDVIVFPSLFLYRLARLGKRKIVGGFNNFFGRGAGDINVRVNGDGPSSADESTK